MKTILLIEDNTDIRENMGEILELAGYNVLLAPNGKEGVREAIEHKPDLIVCDIMMPELDGYGVIHMLQKNTDTQHIPFIFLTAKAERSEMRRGMELGADDYITKPFTGTELLAAIESRMKKREEGRESASASNEIALNIDDVFAEKGATEVFRKKSTIYAARSHPHWLYRVRSGKVKTYRTNDEGKDLITALHAPGDFFGHIALLEGTCHKETAEALEDCEVETLPKDAFERLMRGSATATQMFIRLLAGHVAEREEQLLGLAYNSLRKKVAEALMTLCRKYKAEGDAPFTVRISRDNLAAIAATAKESLIRTLGDFKNEGMIEVHGSDIIVLDESRLSRLLN